MPDVVRIELILLAVVVASAVQFLAALGRPGRASVLVLLRDSAQRAGVYLAVVVGLEILGEAKPDLLSWANGLAWALALAEFAGAVGLAAQGGGTTSAILASIAQELEGQKPPASSLPPAAPTGGSGPPAGTGASP